MGYNYLDTNISQFRLISEWKRYGKLIIAYDFDNTVYDYHNNGLDIKPIVDLLNRAKNIGAYFIVHTARLESEYEFIKKHLIKNNIPFDCINENIPVTGFITKKPFYNILLDDRAGLKSAYEDLKKVVEIMEISKETNKNE